MSNLFLLSLQISKQSLIRKLQYKLNNDKNKEIKQQIIFKDDIITYIFTWILIFMGLTNFLIGITSIQSIQLKTIILIFFLYLYYQTVSNFIFTTIINPDYVEVNTFNYFDKDQELDDNSLIQSQSSHNQKVDLIQTINILSEQKQQQEKQNPDKEFNINRYCRYCNINKQQNVHHCKICNRCVYNQDHHCGFMGTCIGRQSFKYFTKFLLYATITGIISVFITIYHLIKLVIKIKEFKFYIPIFIFDLIFSSFGIVFTSIMLFSNISTIKQDVLGIKTSKTNQKLTNFQQYLGQQWIKWIILPFIA